jgi:CheY-like chemotaxis protein
MQQLLIAIRPEDLGIMSALLGTDFEIAVCHTLTDAQSVLHRKFDLIACGLHFDDGKMFEFLKYVKARPETRAIPFLCIKGAGGVLTPAIFQSILIATEQMGAQGFIDVAELKLKYGDEFAYSMLRQGLHQLLSGPGIRQQ